ncbi:MAG: heme lyase CcmF/NrfE family subunit [Acidimicrobiales bacterium]
MNAALGRSAVLLGFLAAIGGIAVVGTGLFTRKYAILRQAGIYAGLILLAALVATGAMEHALLTHDFSLLYVAQNNSRETPLLFTITGMWSALQGSILLWALILAGYVAAMAWRFRRRAADPVVGWATLTTFVVAAFFFGLMVGPANPFATGQGPVPADGLGPNSLLQNNPLVVIHPPLLYLGFVGFTIPFAFAVGALVTGRLGEGWLVETRRWTLFAWGFLGVGIVLGAWWSYQVLGWGGFWAWDPVENAAFLPWLCATAYLHSVMAQERRGLLRVWNLSLLMATFSLTILGTFLTRSGVLESVHSFSNSDLGPVLIGFFGAVVLASVGLIGWRGDRLRSGASIDTPLSREGGFLVNNLLFAAFAFVVLLGTVFPLFVQALNGQSLTVGRPYFDAMTTPIGLALLFFMAVGPVLSWRRSSPALLRARLVLPAWAGVLTILGSALAGIRGLAPLLAFGLGAFAGVSALRQLALSTRAQAKGGAGLLRGLVGRANGGMVVHLGVVVIGVALAASLSFGHRTQVQLAKGRPTRVLDHTLTYRGTHTVVTPARTEQVADVEVAGRGVLHPGISRFGTDPQGVGSPSISAGLRSDVYVTYDGPPQGPGGPILLGVIVQPLVSWLWIGTAIVAIGTALAAAPRSRRRRSGGQDRSPDGALEEWQPSTDPSRAPLPPGVPVPQ